MAILEKENLVSRMSHISLFQWGVVTAYVAAIALLFFGRFKPRYDLIAVVVTVFAWLIHLLILQARWLEIGQLPIVTRYEDMTVDALAIVGVYLLVQWRIPWLRRAGLMVLPIAALGVGGALWYSLGSFNWTPALRSNWLVIHSQLNSLAIGVGTLAAAAAMLARENKEHLQARKLLAWAFFLWFAMVSAGAYWASLAWGRYWGWDPIESWSLGTLLSYAFVLHLRMRPAWRGRNGAFVGLIPYGMMLFTTYGLLLIRGSRHGSYLFI